MIKTIIFDWGNTLMKDFNKSGPMYLWDYLENVSDIDTLLKKLIKYNIKLIAASSASDSNSEMMKKAFIKTGIDIFFDSFYTSAELKYKKPDTNFFYSILKLENILPAETIVIGDSYEKDYLPSKECGCFSILFDWQKKYPVSIKNRAISSSELFSIIFDNIS